LSVSDFECDAIRYPNRLMILDFEMFFQKSLLPKELQKVNPALLGLNSGNMMRALSPVCREVSEQERDLIKLKWSLKYVLVTDSGLHTL
jgi:hypothetical protein